MKKYIDYLPAFFCALIIIGFIAFAICEDRRIKQEELLIQHKQDSIKQEEQKKYEAELKQKQLEEQKQKRINDSIRQKQKKESDYIQNHPIKKRISIGHGLYIGMSRKEYEKSLKKFVVKKWIKERVGDDVMTYYVLDSFRFTPGNDPTEEFTPVDAKFNNFDNLVSLTLRSGTLNDTYRPNAMFKADVGPLDYDYRFFVKRLKIALQKKYSNNKLSVKTYIDGPYNDGYRFNTVFVKIVFKYTTGVKQGEHNSSP